MLDAPLLVSTRVMDFRAKLKIAAGKRRARRGSGDPPPIGSWERMGWDEWHAERAWEQRKREAKASQAHITTGQFTPIRSRHRFAGSVAIAPVWKVAAVLCVCSSLYLAGRYILL